MGGEGIAPTRGKATGFTDPPAYFNGLAAHIKMTLSQSTAYLLITGTFALPISHFFNGTPQVGSPDISCVFCNKDSATNTKSPWWLITADITRLRALERDLGFEPRLVEY